jgi:peroxiredoxin
LSRILTAGVVALAISTIACSSGDHVSAASTKKEKQVKLAPDFALKDMDGRTAKLSDYRGKVVLLNFWATWCGPCKVEIPWFMDFENKYKDRGFAVVGVSMDEDGWAAVKPYLAERRINYRILLGNDDVGQQYGGVDSLPTSFVIDRDGRIVGQHVGLVSKSDYENEIKELVGGGRTSAAGTLHASLHAN